MSAQGRDFSDFQPIQTVAELKALDFAFFKATEGTFWTGQTFPGNWKNAELAGIPRGAYHFLHPSEDPVSQAEHFLNTVDPQGFKSEDMLVIDTEILSGLRSHTNYEFTDSLALVDATSKAFMDKVKSSIDPAHHPMIVYTDHYVGQYLAETALAYPLLWFAWPSSSAPPASLYAPWHAWKFWQWGAINGVDRDAYDGGDTELKNWLGGYNVTTRPVAVIITDGKESLHEVSVRYANKPERIVARTLEHGLHPRLVAYLAEHPHLTAPMPKGIHLWVAEGKA